MQRCKRLTGYRHVYGADSTTSMAARHRAEAAKHLRRGSEFRDRLVIQLWLGPIVALPHDRTWMVDYARACVMAARRQRIIASAWGSRLP